MRGDARGRRRRDGPSERPEPIGGLVERILERLGIAERVARARTASRWEEVAGPEIARHTGGVRVDGKTLFVEVESAAWLTELDMMRRRLLEGLNEGRERGRIEKIVFLQADGPGEGRGRRERERGRD